MEELEILLKDLKSCIEAKEAELVKNGNHNSTTKSTLKVRYTEIKFFEFSFDCYKLQNKLGPDIIEKMKKEHQRIKSEIEMIGLL